MPVSHYNAGFPNGVTIRNVPLVDLQNADGKVLWVDNGRFNSSDQNKGTSIYPLKTIQKAIDLCQENKGYRIIVAAGHVESVSTIGGITFNKEGITIEFLGEGTDTGTIDFNTSPSASLIVGSNNIVFINPRFTASVDGLTNPINVQSANCSIMNGSYHDSDGVGSALGIIVSINADSFVLNGFKYIHGLETGTQKLSFLLLNGCQDAVIKDVHISGDFEDGNIDASLSAPQNLILENIVLKNTNATPAPGIKSHSITSGQAKNVDIRITSGTVYVSDLAKINWDNNCLGYNSDGSAGDPVGTPPILSIEGKIDSIQEDIGDPSSRTNHQNIEDMIGIPDSANSSLDDILRTGFDSSSIVQNADGSVIEILKYLKEQIIPDLGGLVFSGACDIGMTPSTTTIVASSLGGYGNDIFNDKYYMQIIRNSNSIGNAPEKEVRLITDYVSGTGTFTVNAFTVNAEENDKLLVLHESLIAIGRNDADNAFDSSAVTPNQNGSLIERNEYVKYVLDDTALDVDALVLSVGNPTGDTLASLTAKFGDGSTTVAADFSTLKTNVGDPSGDTLTSLTAKLGDGSTTVSADLGTLKTDTTTLKTDIGDPSGDTLTSLTAKLGDGSTSVAADLGTLKTDIGDPSGDTLTSLTAKLGDGSTTVAADLGTLKTDTTTLKTDLGDPSGDTLISITAKLGDGATTMAADFSTLKTNVGDPSGDTLTSLTTKLGDSSTSVATHFSDVKGAGWTDENLTTIDANVDSIKATTDVIRTDVGTVFTIKKTLTSSNITTSGVDVTGLSATGELLIEDIILKTDATGLSGGTNLQIFSTNSKGEDNILQESIVNLGANETVSMCTATVGACTTVLELAKKVRARTTVANGTGAGTVDVYIKFRRIAQGAHVSPAA